MTKSVMNVMAGRWAISFVVAAAVTAGVAGCGGGGAGGSSSGPTGSVSVSQLATQYSQAMCAQNFKCCSAADLNGHTMQDCLSANISLLGVLAADISTGQTKNRLSYDAAKMGMCIDAIKALSCDAWNAGLSPSTQPAVCQAAITAKVAAGGACETDEECLTGHCDGANSSASPPVDGTCTMLAVSGASCATVDCGDGLYCASPSHTCAAKKAGGQSCTSDDECMNLCNTTTNLCSTYVGCSVGGGAPRPGLLALVLLATAAWLGGRSRRRRAAPPRLSVATTSRGARRRQR